MNAELLAELFEEVAQGALTIHPVHGYGASEHFPKEPENAAAAQITHDVLYAIGRVFRKYAEKEREGR